MIQQSTQEIWPVSIAGWVAFFVSLLALVGGIFAGGKFYGRLNDIIDEVKKLQEIDDQREADYTILKHIIIGPLGNNGLVSKVSHIDREVGLIIQRNTRLDAVRNTDEEGADRRRNRRKEDKLTREDDIDDASNS